MGAFEFFCLPRIVLGRGSIARLGELAKGLGTRALVVHSPVGMPANLSEVMGAAGVTCALHIQDGEPKVSDIDAALAAARGHGADLVIGLGGGSAIDAAKATAGLLTNGGTALDYMEVVGQGRKITKQAAPWIAMPTTAGTGAEATRNAVIGYPPARFKASVRSEYLLARVALIDPELGVSVPPAVTASCGMDALCQLIESYTSTGANPMTDALALPGIVLAARSLRRAYQDGADIDAREDMALAALWSGITLANAGLGAVHGFAAPLGANFPVPHGTVCAALLPPVMAANVGALRAISAQHPVLARYTAIGRAVTGRSDLADAPAIDAAIGGAAALVRDLRISPLSQFGIGENDVAPMVALARKASSMKFNPIVLSDEALAQVLRQGISPVSPVVC